MKNQGQIDYWNGKVGERWALQADRLDSLLEPFAVEILDSVMLQHGERALDVGCGAGALSMMAAFQVGARGSATGIDVSQPLLDLARHRADLRLAPAQFERADAADYCPPAQVDALISRFGVMFFDDPVPAFANLRNAVRDGGRLVFACWQSLSSNDWARAPLDAALPLLPEPPQAPPPHAPGPFAFADKDRVADILTNAGWHDVQIVPWLGRLTLPGNTPSESAQFMIKLGPVARLVAESGIDLETVCRRLEEVLQAQLGPDGTASLPAAAWIVSAKAL